METDLMRDNLKLFFGNNEYHIYPNRFGMKYWAGAVCPKGAVSKKEIEKRFFSEGKNDIRFFYPYPDYYFPLTIYSDDFLPKTGELRENIVNFDEDRFVFFDEGDRYDEVIEDGQYPYFANSFIVVPQVKKELPVFARFAADRDRRFAIATFIYKNENNTLRVQKRPIYTEGRDHFRHIFEVKQSLSKLFEGIFEINECRIVGDTMGLEYVNGEPLSVLIAEKNDMELFDKFVSLLKKAETIEYKETDGFAKVFGQVGCDLSGLRCLSVTDIDLIPQNIMVSKDRWVVIDYEWTFDFPIPLDFVIYRAIFAVSQASHEDKEALFSGSCDRYGISAEKIAAFKQMEEHFQSYVCGGKPAIREMVDKNGRLHADMRRTGDELLRLNTELEHIKNTKWWRFRSFIRGLVKH